MTHINSTNQASPTFNLKDLPEIGYASWRDHAIERATRAKPKLRKLADRAKNQGSGLVDQLTYLLGVYETVMRWQARGISDQMMFGATYLTNPTALCREVDLFEAALRLSRSPGYGYSVGVTVAASACKRAWSSQWDRDRFELELLRFGIRQVAKQWTDQTGDSVDQMALTGVPVRVNPEQRRAA